MTQTTRPEIDSQAEDALRPILAKHGFLRILRWLEGEALKHGSLAGVHLAGWIDAKNYHYGEPLDTEIGK